MDLFRITIDLPLPDDVFERAEEVVSIKRGMDSTRENFVDSATIRHEIVPAQPAEPVRTRKPRAPRAPLPDIAVAPGPDIETAIAAGFGGTPAADRNVDQEAAAQLPSGGVPAGSHVSGKLGPLVTLGMDGSLMAPDGTPRRGHKPHTKETAA